MLLSSLPVAATVSISFVYDYSGRLIAAYDHFGNVANYRYDALGNLTQIVTSNASSALVFGYSQDSAQPGATLIIFGNDFSATAAQDTVTVGGEPAAVQSASPGQLTVQLSGSTPTGSDAVTVNCPAGSATGPNLTVN